MLVKEYLFLFSGHYIFLLMYHQMLSSMDTQQFVSSKYILHAGIDLPLCFVSIGLDYKVNSISLLAEKALYRDHTFYCLVNRLCIKPDPEPALQIILLLILLHNIYCKDLFAAIHHLHLTAACK